MESKQIHLLTYKMALMVFLLAPLSAFSTSTGAMGQVIKNISASDNVTTASILLIIPNGASVQGNPSYEPSQLTVNVGETIAVENKDIAPHTVTNGKDATDPTMGKFFDTSIINAGDSGEILTSELKPGEYPFFCAVHPYMAGILDVRDGSQASTEAPVDERESITGEEQPVVPVKADPDLIKELLNNAIENLRNGNNDRAVAYMDFVRQQLSLQTTNVTMPQSTEVLVGDAIDSLQRGDTDSATLYLNQANDQLALLTGYNQTSISEADETIQDSTRVVQYNETSSQLETDTISPLITLVPWESSRYGLKIQYPSTWEVSEFTDANVTTVASFHPPQNGSESLEQFYIEILDLPSPSVILNETIQPTVDNLKSSLDDFRLIESRSTTLAGLPAHQIVYTKMGGIPGNIFQMKDLQIWTVKDNKEYNLYYTAPAIDFAKSLGNIQRMIDSFEITNESSLDNSSKMMVQRGEPRNITDTENLANLIEYNNPKFGFKISYPSNWEKREFNREYTNLIVQFRGPDTTISDNITNPIRWDITLLDEKYGGKLYTDIDEVFDARLQMYSGPCCGDVLNSQKSTHNGYPFYTISRDVGSSIITEYVIIANGRVYLLSWEISDSLDYNQFLPIADKMIDSFEITNTTMIPSDDATISESGTVTENLTGFETQVTNTTGNITYTQSGARLLGELYISGDRYIDIEKPTGAVETCIDNNSNLVCDITEPNAPPSCRFDGTHCDMTGSGPNVTQGPLSPSNDSSFTASIPTTGGINWEQTCQQLDAILIPSCSSLVYPNNALTGEGERAVGCIRNGLLLAGGGALLSMPLPVMIPILQALSEPTGCGGIIEWNFIGSVGDLRGIIGRLT